MSALGSLVVKLALEYAEYTRGLDKSSQAALKFAQNSQRSFDSAGRSAKQYFGGMVAGAASAVVAYAGLYSVIDRLSSSVNMLARLDDMAQKTGSSVENLSKIQKTVAAFGGDFGAVDTAIAKLAKGMGTVDSDTNKANNALRALGLSARDAAGNLRDPSQVMVEIAHNLQSYADGAGKTALATDLFGRAGAELLPVLNDVADNVDRFSGVSTTAAQQASLMKDQVGLLSGQISALYTGAAIRLLPALTNIAAAFNSTSGNTTALTVAANAAGLTLKALVVTGATVGLVFDRIAATIGAAAAQMLRFTQLDFAGVTAIGRQLVANSKESFAGYTKFVDTVLNGNAEITSASAKIAGHGNATNKPQLAYQSGAKPSTGSATGEYDKLIGSIREKTAAQALELDGQAKLTAGQTLALDAMVKLRDGTLNLSASQKAKLAGELESLLAMEQSTLALHANRKAADDLLDAGQRQIAGTRAQLDTLREQNAQIGLSNDQIVALVGVKEQELAINLRNAAEYAGPLHDAYLQHANDLDTLAGLQRDLVKEKQIAQAGADWKNMWQTMEQTGRMAFVQFAAHGTSAMKSIGQAIKMSILDMLYQLTVRKWIINIGTSLGGTFLNGFANAAGGSIGGGISGATGGVASGGASSGMGIASMLRDFTSGISAMASMFAGGGASMVGSIAGAGLQTLGAAFGSSAATSFGLGLAATSSEIAAAAGASALWGATGTTAAASLGMDLALALDPLTLALAGVDIGLRMLVGDLRIGGTFGKIVNYIPVIGPILNGLFGHGAKKPTGPQELVGNLSAAGFAGDLQTPWKSKGGLFMKNRYGAFHADVPPELKALLASSIMAQASVFVGLIKAAGDSSRSLDGWSMRIKSQIIDPAQ